MSDHTLPRDRHGAARMLHLEDMGSRLSPASARVGRYAVFEQLAFGGMATVHLARLLGEGGFKRTVAVKRLHPQFAKDPESASMLVDEARIVARINHPNVVQTLDVVRDGEELLLVMEYVHGESLSRLLRATSSGTSPGAPPLGILVRVMCDVLHGLHAAHEATDEEGNPLGIVHRDVSPQNVLVGADGVARVLDFGVAKANGRLQSTGDGQIKGKLSYMAPEQLGGEATRRTDLFAAGVVLWESLTGARLFFADDPREIMSKVLSAPIDPPTSLVPSVPPAIETVVMHALRREPSERFKTAAEMAWVRAAAGEALAERAALVRSCESQSAEGAVSGVGLKAQHAGDRDVTVTVASSTVPTSVTTGKSRRLAWMALTATLATALGLAVVRGPRPSPAPAGPALSEAVATPRSVSAYPPPPAVLDSAPVAAQSAPTPSSPPPDPGPRKVTSKPRGVPARVIPSAPRPLPSGPPGVDCNPPYRLGAHGEKVWIPECL
jgi:eukaryotic-like serine/threonine-protein kinase